MFGPDFKPMTYPTPAPTWPWRTEPVVGWRCPGCRRCFAPTVVECLYCQPERTDKR